MRASAGSMSRVTRFALLVVELVLIGLVVWLIDGVIPASAKSSAAGKAAMVAVSLVAICIFALSDRALSNWLQQTKHR